MGMRGSYGEHLRQARIRRGMDIHSVARRLRIRTDILNAIEEADFAALPPSGYTRNMVTAYARLVGLDPRQIAEGYLDELYRFETGRGLDRAPAEPARRRGAAPSRAALTNPLDPPARRAPERGIYDRNGTQRVRYNIYDHYASTPLPAPDPATDPGIGAAPRSARRPREARPLAGAPPMPSSRERASRRSRSLGPSPSVGQYAPTTFSRGAGTSASRGGLDLQALLGRLPLVLAAIAVVVLLIVVVAMAFGGERQGADEVPAVPISGLTDTSGQSQDAYNVATAVAPTSATLTVSVADGEKSWISVYVNGAEDAEFNEVMQGGERTFTFTQSIRVVAGNPTPVTLKVDGEEVQLQKTDSGSWAYSAQFSDILAAWEEKHGTKASSSSSAAAASSSSSSSSAAASS